MTTLGDLYNLYTGNTSLGDVLSNVQIGGSNMQMQQMRPLSQTTTFNDDGSQTVTTKHQVTGAQTPMPTLGSNYQPSFNFPSQNITPNYLTQGYAQPQSNVMPAQTQTMAPITAPNSYVQPVNAQATTTAGQPQAVVSDTGQIQGYETPSQIISGMQTNAPISNVPESNAPSAIIPTAATTANAVPQGGYASTLGSVQAQPYVDQFMQNQDHNLGLLNMAQDANAPQWIKDVAKRKTYSNLQHEQDMATANQKMAEMQQTGQYNDLVRAFSGKQTTGDKLLGYLSAIGFNLLGLKDASRDQLAKMGVGSTYQYAYGPDNQVYLMHTLANGMPVEGYDSATGRKLSGDELARAGATFIGKPTGTSVQWDSSDGKTHTGYYADTPGGRRLLDSVTNQPVDMTSVNSIRHIGQENPMEKRAQDSAKRYRERLEAEVTKSRAGGGLIPYTPQQIDQMVADHYNKVRSGATQPIVEAGYTPPSQTSAYGASTGSNQTLAPNLNFGDIKVNSGIGMRTDPITGKQAYHAGYDLDVTNKRPITPMLSPEFQKDIGGTVSEVTPEAKSGGYGNTVVVTRPDGTRVRYAHLSSLNVNPGDTINRDTVYGASGSTGKSTGEHLHYEILAPNKPNSELPKESRGNEPTKFVTSGPVYRQAQQQNPNLINEALAVLNGQKQMPSGMGANNYHNRALTNLVFEMDPNFNTQSYKTTQQFTTGKQGDVVRSMNVAIDHLDTLQRAAIDLNNNNFPAVNRILNPLQSAFGYPEVTSFDGIKSIVGSEVAKATTGGNMALGDREEIRQVLDNWKSPKQTSDVISKLQQLLGGQLKGLRTQYQAGGGKDFDKFLAPRTKQVLGTEEIPENKPMTPAEKARAEQERRRKQGK